MICEAIKHSRNLERHSCPHQDISHASEHSAINGRQVRQLDFFQVIDSDWIVVSFTRQNDFNKIGYDTQFL